MAHRITPSLPGYFTISDVAELVDAATARGREFPDSPRDVPGRPIGITAEIVEQVRILRRSGHSINAIAESGLAPPATFYHWLKVGKCSVHGAQRELYLATLEPPREEQPTPRCSRDIGLTCLYRLYSSDGTLLYVGVANDPIRRMKEHRANRDWFGEVAGIRFETHATRREAEDAEAEAIRAEHPRHNIAGVPSEPA